MTRELALVGALLVATGCTTQPSTRVSPRGIERSSCAGKPSKRASPSVDAKVSVPVRGNAGGVTPSPEQTLTTAIERGQIQSVSELLERGADANMLLDDLGTTPLMLAVEHGRADILRLLIERGARVNEQRPDGETALTLAAWYGRMDVVDILLARGSNVNAETAAGETALSLANQEGHQETAELLRKEGARGGGLPTVPASKLGSVTVSQPPDAKGSRSIDPSQIQAVVRPQYGRFRLCYEQGLHGCPNLEGRITVRFVIGLDGRVVKARPAESDISDAEVVHCVIRAVKSFVFRKGEGPLTVQYPIMFSPG